MDDLSPGDGQQMNGSKFFTHSTSSSTHTKAQGHLSTPTPSHYSSSLSLSSTSSSTFRNGTSSNQTKGAYPNLSVPHRPSLASASSSPSWSLRSAGSKPTMTNGHGGLNGLNSTTAALLSGKTNHGNQNLSTAIPRPTGLQTAFSKSVSNLNSSASAPNFDLLGSIDSEVNSAWETTPAPSSYQQTSQFPSSHSSRPSGLSSHHQANRHSAYYDYSSCNIPVSSHLTPATCWPSSYYQLASWCTFTFTVNHILFSGLGFISPP